MPVSKKFSGQTNRVPETDTELRRESGVGRCLLVIQMVEPEMWAIPTTSPSARTARAPACTDGSTSTRWEGTATHGQGCTCCLLCTAGALCPATKSRSFARLAYFFHIWPFHSHFWSQGPGGTPGLKQQRASQMLWQERLEIWGCFEL